MGVAKKSGSSPRFVELAVLNELIVRVSELDEGFSQRNSQKERSVPVDHQRRDGDVAAGGAVSPMKAKKKKTRRRSGISSWEGERGRERKEEERGRKGELT